MLLIKTDISFYKQRICLKIAMKRFTLIILYSAYRYSYSYKNVFAYDF